MAKPGSSRRKKTIVALSSDDETKPKSNRRPKCDQKRDTSTALKNASLSPQVRRNRPNSSKALNGAKNGATGPISSQSTPTSSPAKNRLKPVNAKPIYSFFNAATQKQQIRRSSSPEKPESIDNVAVENDLILDDDSQDDKISMRTASRFGEKYPMPTRQKRKLDNLEDDRIQGSRAPRGSQMFRLAPTTPSSSHRPHQAEEDTKPWMERFGPTDLAELAVHKKKVQDVRTWLAMVLARKEPKSMLILRGPAGSGKTTTLSLLANELCCNVQEWRNPNHQAVNEEGYVSMAAQFEDFVLRAGRFGTLDIAGQESQKLEAATQDNRDRKDIILIEEFPNTFARTSSVLQNFRNAVSQYLYATTPSLNTFFSSNDSQLSCITPIVMIISETLLSTATASSDSFTAHRLLGPEILTHPGVTVIDFNPIAPTFMTKALELVLRKESRKSGRRTSPGPAVLKQLSELGDIRSAISSLEFLCLRGDEHDGWSGKISFVKGKNSTSNNPATNAELESLGAITHRESTLGIFHAVGKVVHNKREAPAGGNSSTPQPPSFLPQHSRPKVSEVNIEALLNELGTDIQIFIAALHENYVLSCGGITAEDTLDSVNSCIDFLSESDILSPDRFSNSHRRNFQGTAGDNLRQDEISFQTSVRGLLFSLPHPVKRLPLPANLSGNGSRPQRTNTSASYQMFYPKSQQLWRRIEENKEVLEQLIAKLQNETSAHNSSFNPISQTTAGGVDTWRRHQNFAGQSTPPVTSKEMQLNQRAEEVDSSATAAAMWNINRDELLLERLPYMTVLEKKKASRSASALLRDLEKLTRITGAPTKPDDDAENAEEDSDAGQHWSTDKATEDSGSPRKNNRFGIKSKSTDSVAGLKEKAAHLVLSDDDIVDD